MNKDTGQIRILEPNEQPTENEIPLDKLPKPTCKHCHGRGWVGRDVNEQVIPCRCVLDKKDKFSGLKWYDVCRTRNHNIWRK